MDLRQRARELFAQGHIHDAFEAAQAACDQQPKDAEAWHLLGCICRHAGMPSTGDGAFDRAAALDPERFPKPLRVPPDRFRELAERARPQGGGDFEVVGLPALEDIRSGVAPQARWSRPGTGLVLYQANHENGADSEEQLVSLLEQSWREGIGTAPV